jgi:hypothetical protein
MRFYTGLIITISLVFLSCQKSNRGAIMSPILIIAAQQDFGLYVEEIVKTEGIKTFDRAAPSEISKEKIEKYDVLVLAQTGLPENQAGMLKEYVKSGGALIAFKPCPELCEVVDITVDKGKIDQGYIRIDTQAGIARGLVGETIQFHGSSDLYKPGKPWTVIAELCSTSSSPTGHAAVCTRKIGRGSVTIFSYNLPGSVVLTRQGNPDMAGKEGDGILGIRGADMFVNWIDPAKVHIPQADEQMRLVTRIIEAGFLDKAPLPRLWYFPDMKRALVLLTNDGENSPAQEIEPELKLVEKYGGRMTVYLKGAYLDSSVVTAWAAAGHEMAVHPDDTKEATAPDPANMKAEVIKKIKEHRTAYGITPVTVRNHWIVWTGWDDQARIEAEQGLGFDCNYYHYQVDSKSGDFLGGPGHFTGSGIPMKFAGRNGEILNIYQSVTQIPDEQWEPDIFGPFKQVLDRSLDQGYYAYINANFHSDRQHRDREDLEKVLAYAQKRGVPMWTAQRTMEFLRFRDCVEIGSLEWRGNVLRFELKSPVPGEGLTLMVPLRHEGMSVNRIMVDDKPVKYATETIKQIEYVFAAADIHGTHKISVQYQ